MNFLDKHNKMLFVMAKESISRRDLNKAEKIKKESYDSSSSGNSSVSRK